MSGVGRLSRGNPSPFIHCDANSITFETNDSYIVMHHGPYTLIGAKNELSGKKFSDGPRFFDPK